MNVSILVDKVLKFASRYEKNKGASGKEHSIDVVFSYLLKVAEDDAKTNAEAKELEDKIVDEFKDKPFNLRGKLKEHLEVSDEGIALYKQVKDELEKKKSINTLDLFDAIMNHASSNIKALIPEKKEESQVGTKEKKEQDAKEMSPAYKKDSESNIEDLVLKLRDMRDNLLEEIYGQDHAVNTFIDGYWNAEMAAMTQETKKKVRGLFVFAGPSGVGKTFLAEEAAKQLELPCKRFDMSGYAYRESICDLTGFSSTYKDAKRGLLTEFVSKNPKCVLIFDEIEKAHKDVIMLFLQILDGGALQELYDGSVVSFADATIIFTTNAGRDLYEFPDFTDASNVSKQQVIDALVQDINPETKQPYFPAAICSRLSTGNVVMFNNLTIKDLEKICRNQFNKVAEQIDKTFGISVEMDKETLAALIYKSGGNIDARNMTQDIHKFVQGEFKKFLDLFSTESIRETVSSVGRIMFSAELEEVEDNIKKLFVLEDKQNLLMVGANMMNDLTIQEMKKCNVIKADTDEAIEKAFMNQPIDLVLLQLDSELPVEFDEDSSDTVIGFNYIPVGASALATRRSQIIDIHRNNPEVPIYILKTGLMQIDRELELTLRQEGVRGFISMPTHKGMIKKFVEEIDEIGRDNYLQKQARILQRANKLLTFETAPKLDKENNTVVIRVRNFELHQEVSVTDKDEVNVATENIKTRFKDVIGAEEAKKELQYFVDYLLNPNEFISRRIDAPKGVLLYGNPGTGKTMLARAMAGEAKVAFIATEGSSFVNKYQGSGAEAVRKLFNRARKYAPAIIFIDEIDTIGRQRTGESNTAGAEAALNALLAEMDGIRTDPKKPVFVLAATNYMTDVSSGGIGTIDPALARRFDKKIRVGLPNKENRKQFLEMKLKEIEPHNVSYPQISQIVDRSVGMSLAELNKVVESAKRDAMKAETNLEDSIFNEAFETYVNGAQEGTWKKEYLEKVAVHEAGHAVVSYKVGHAPSYITIVARGNHGGYMQYEKEDMPMSTRTQLLDQIKICLGGRAAELLYYKEDGLTTGVSDDLKQATEIAKAMVCKYGMDEEMGLIALSKEDLKNPVIAEKIYTKVKNILAEQLEETKKILESSKTVIDAMKQSLLDKNQLDAMEIEDIVLENDSLDGDEIQNEKEGNGGYCSTSL
nr:AAA family ATPase [uncultured Anaerobutyricum sp.]